MPNTSLYKLSCGIIHPSTFRGSTFISFLCQSSTHLRTYKHRLIVTNMGLIVSNILKEFKPKHKICFSQFYFTCKMGCQHIFWGNVDDDNAINDYHAAHHTHHHCTKQGKAKSLLASLWRISYFWHFDDSLLIRTCFIDCNSVFWNLVPENQQTFQLTKNFNVVIQYL